MPVEAVLPWNEPNNMSHWDFDLDKAELFAEFRARMTRRYA